MSGSDGRTHLLYELTIQNVTPLELGVAEIEISDPEGTVIRTLDAEETADALSLPAARRGNEALADGQSGLLFLTLAFGSEAEVPDQLEHRVTVAADEFPDGTFTASEITVEVDKDFDVPVLGPPIEAGDRYVAADGCCESERHVRAALGIGDQQWIAQRFAIDWEQLDAGDRFLQGDPENPEDYTVYGQQALAAADGEVVLVIDGLDEQVPGELPGMALSLDEADGNSVVIRIGDGLYLSYAHMQAGSITVAEGEEVERGAVIGLVGNSGNTSAPHLHVHLMDGPSPLATSGLPYVIESFETTGAIPSTELFDRIENTADRVPLKPAPGEGENADELPLDQTIVNFP